MKVKEKVIVVTGAGNGLGRSLTLQLLKSGAKVVAVDVRMESLEETAKIAGVKEDKLLTIATDITDRSMVNKLPQKIIEAYGVVDGLINNAGVIQPFVRVNDLDFESIERVMNINFYGAVNMTKAFLPYLLDRPEAHIVNISSMGGFLPVPGQSIYGASKAALKLFTEGLYAELLDTNVRVTVVFPGGMSTNIASNSGVQMDDTGDKSSYKMLGPDVAAQLILSGMMKDKFRIKVGSDSKTMDVLYRLNPRFATNLIYKKMKSLLKG